MLFVKVYTESLIQTVQIFPHRVLPERHELEDQGVVRKMNADTDPVTFLSFYFSRHALKRFNKQFHLVKGCYVGYKVQVRKCVSV